MRQVLLDTNAVIWFAREPHLLGAEAKSMLQKADQRFVSVVTNFEIIIKVMNGKLQFATNLDQVVDALNASYLAVESKHIEAVTAFPELKKHDPFDRILLAQAKAEGLVLLTADKQLLDLGLDYVIDATK